MRQLARIDFRLAASGVERARTGEGGLVPRRKRAGIIRIGLGREGARGGELRDKDAGDE
ncbi:hypothetical protein [Pacificimonas flava]|uniref:hypothetical protein n=1 Tax=Pacificimonas flava TaxID=1234595 RepID=UPI001853DDEF|nr:hypothetical protein [Pacificimonas flava]MBB5280406.1 hypothetical protein [Pacificimonas flava]